MTFVALLRGINVGGNSTVSMGLLRKTFERLGLSQVRTYINSGNVIFQDETHSSAELVTRLETAIEEDFGFAVKVLVRDFPSIQKIHAALPAQWVNDHTMKCDVMFLWEHVDEASVLDQLIIKPAIDEVKYVPGAILWRVDRENVTKSGLLKLVGTQLYKAMTIRNCNTVRKLFELMNEK
jgi:uncharacterized protein (DUF1697 family)